MQSKINELPYEIHHLITTFATFEETYNYVKTCKQIHNFSSRLIATRFRSIFTQKADKFINVQKLVDFSKRNGCVFFGSIILQVIFGCTYQRSDIDFIACKPTIFEYYPEENNNFGYIVENERHIYSSTDLHRSESKNDDIWPQSLGICRSRSRTNAKCMMADNNELRYISDMIGMKVIDIVVPECSNSKLNYVLFQDENAKTPQESIKSSIDFIMSDYDLDVCGNAFWIDENNVAHLQVLNMNGVLTKFATINPIISNIIVTQMIYGLDIDNKEIRIAKEQPHTTHARFLKYIERGFVIHNNKSEHKVNLSNLRIHYPMNIATEQANEQIELYKSLPHTMYAISDLSGILPEHSYVNIRKIKPYDVC